MNYRDAIPFSTRFVKYFLTYETIQSAWPDGSEVVWCRQNDPATFHCKDLHTVSCCVGRFKRKTLEGYDNEYQGGEYYRNTVVSTQKYIITLIDFSFFSGNHNMVPGP